VIGALEDVMESATVILGESSGPKRKGKKKGSPGEAADRLSDIIGPTFLASAAALATALAERPRMLLIIDELGEVFESSNRKSGGPLKGLQRELKNLYSTSSKGQDKGYANPEMNIKTEWHSLSFYGTGVGTRFWDGLTVNDLGDGFVARNLVMLYRPKTIALPRKPTEETMAVPRSLAEGVAAFHRIPLRGAAFPDRDARKPTPLKIPDSPEAEEILSAYQLDQLRKGEALRDDQDGVASIYHRQAEIARKIALITAASRAGGVPREVGAEDARYAVALVDWCVTRLVRTAREKISWNAQDQLKRQILKMITDKGYVTVRDVYRNIRGCDSRQAEDALNILCHAGQAERVSYKGILQFRRVTKKDA
jgi:hypothetical protein